jgi:hypothetical protein
MFDKKSPDRDIESLRVRFAALLGYPEADAQPL